jgi:UDP-N-acetylmuramate: L-alanyl-gamma-D-glutamyl-meso-diaminopimelate ligase
VRELAKKSFAPVDSFAFDAANTGADAEAKWRAVDVSYGEVTRFRVLRAGEDWGVVETPLAGAFNVRNCLAAIAAAEAIGADPARVREGLRTYRSVRRRMEVRGVVDGVTVIDDFAHHPTAVRETLEGTRSRYQGRRVVAVFEPRSYTAQRREFQKPYQDALGAADEIILAGLFHPERYSGDTAMQPAEMVAAWQQNGRPAQYLPDVDDIVRTLAQTLRAGDVVLIMSNGGFGGIHEKLLRALEARGAGAGA